jgi:osmoprotectant transport system ATP-binding protein
MRALLLDPEVLLLDEPLSALDPLVRTELRDDLRGIFRSLAKTVIVVTHDVGEAAHLADVVVLMRAGRVVQQGPFAALATSPADPFVTAFLATGNGMSAWAAAAETRR